MAVCVFIEQREKLGKKNDGKSDLKMNICTNKTDRLPKIKATPGLAGKEGYRPKESADKTVFVSNLDFAATEEEVREALKEVGIAEEVRLVKDPRTHQSRGFAYVTFATKDLAEAALKLDRIRVHSRPMFISQCEEDKNMRKPVFNFETGLEVNKLFVKGFPAATNEGDLRKMFEEFGPVESVRIPTKKTGESKGVAYVEFKDAETAAKAMERTDGREIGGKTIKVAISHPPDKKKLPFETEMTLGSAAISKTRRGGLSFIPRALQKSQSGKTDVKMDTSGNERKKFTSNEEFRKMLLKGK